jgi:hypothetical protein
VDHQRRRQAHEGERRLDRRPNEYTLLVVRDAIVVNPDPESERERGQDAATRVMREVCNLKGLSPRVLDDRLVQQINYYVRFRCV